MARRSYQKLPSSSATSFWDVGIIDAPDTLQITPVPVVPRNPPEIKGATRLMCNGSVVAVFADVVTAGRALGPIKAFAELHRQERDAVFNFDGNQPEVADDVPTVGRALRGVGPRLLDAAFTRTTSLRFVLAPAEDGASCAGIRLFQAVPSSGDDLQRLTLTCVGEAGLAGSAPASLTSTLLNPLLPLLVVLLDAEGYATDIGMIAFPSLARGGLHSGEVRALSPCADPALAFLIYDRARFDEKSSSAPALCGVVVNTDTALLSEPIFSADVAEWLMLVFGMRVINAQEGIAVAGPHLDLPPDCLPTIAALTAPQLLEADELGRQVDFLVCDRVSYAPRHAVHFPTRGIDLSAGQPAPATTFPKLRYSLARHSGALLKEPPNLLALRFRPSGRLHEAAMLFPHAPDRAEWLLPALPKPEPDIKAICHLDVSEADAARSVLDTISRQIGAERMVTMVAGASEDEMHELEPMLNELPGGWRTVPRHWDPFRTREPGQLEQLDDWPDATVLLRVRKGTLLHDPRLLEVLLALLQIQGVAMVGSVTLSELPSRGGAVLSLENGGWFPSHVNIVGAPAIVLSAVDTLEALPDCTYPVAAPPEDVFALRLGTLRRLHQIVPHLDGGAQAGLLTGLALTAMGETCLCTSVVRAVSACPPSYRGAMDCVGRAEIPIGRWLDIVERVTLVQKVN